jgi:hypothetical protein
MDEIVHFSEIKFQPHEFWEGYKSSCFRPFDHLSYVVIFIAAQRSLFMVIDLFPSFWENSRNSLRIWSKTLVFKSYREEQRKQLLYFATVYAQSFSAPNAKQAIPTIQSKSSSSLTRRDFEIEKFPPLLLFTRRCDGIKKRERKEPRENKFPPEKKKSLKDLFVCERRDIKHAGELSDEIGGKRWEAKKPNGKCVLNLKLDNAINVIHTHDNYFSLSSSDSSSAIYNELNGSER